MEKINRRPTPEILVQADLVSRVEAAAMLGVHWRTLWKWNKQGYGPRPTRMGWKIFYRRAAIVEWLANLECEPADMA